MENSGDKKRLLVVTSTFPRWKDDRDPPFVYQLCKGLVSDYRVWVLAPHCAGAKIDEILDGIRIKRFRYFLPSLERLAYDGGILSGLRKNPARYILIPFFFTGQLLALIQLLRKRQFCLTHAHWLIPQGLAAIIAGKIAGKKIPLLCTSHGGGSLRAERQGDESNQKYGDQRIGCRHRCQSRDGRGGGPAGSRL